MEDYKSEYEAALARAKAVYLTDDDKKGAMETVFPELMELDKDDEIRQALIKYFTIWSKDTSHTWGFKNEDIIDWLKRVKSVRVKSAKVTTGKLAEMIEQKALEDFKRINPWTLTVGLSHHEATKKSEQDVPTNRTEEDERVRKELIAFVDTNTLSTDERHSRWISWLEKHGKQEWTDKDTKMIDILCCIFEVSDTYYKIDRQGQYAISSKEILDWLKLFKQKLK